MIVFGKDSCFLADNGKKMPLSPKIPPFLAAKEHSVPPTIGTHWVYSKILNKPYIIDTRPTTYSLRAPIVVGLVNACIGPYIFFLGGTNIRPHGSRHSIHGDNRCDSSKEALSFRMAAILSAAQSINSSTIGIREMVREVSEYSTLGGTSAYTLRLT